jgi:hypothetical protein
MGMMRDRGGSQERVHTDWLFALVIIKTVEEMRIEKW